MRVSSLGALLLSTACVGDVATPGTTLFFKSTQPVTGDFRIFVHGDQTGTRHRIHADHYPPGSTETWPLRSLVVDRVDIVIPKETEKGYRQFYIGFFSADRRLQVLDGCRQGDRACGPLVKID